MYLPCITKTVAFICQGKQRVCFGKWGFSFFFSSEKEKGLLSTFEWLTVAMASKMG